MREHGREYWNMPRPKRAGFNGYGLLLPLVMWFGFMFGFWGGAVIEKASDCTMTPVWYDDLIVKAGPGH